MTGIKITLKKNTGNDNKNKSITHEVKVEKTNKFKKIGQLKRTPPETDALYKFYKSLYQQKPDSTMAMTWMLEHGCFTPKKAEKIALILSVKNIKI